MNRYFKSLLSAALLFAAGCASVATISPERVGVCSWSWRLPMKEVAAKMDDYIPSDAEITEALKTLPKV